MQPAGAPPPAAPPGLGLLALLLPRHLRDAIVGDLLEEHAAGSLPGPRLALLAIAWQHHRAGYQVRSDAAALLRLHAVALLAVLALPLAGTTVLAGAGAFDGLLATGTRALWSAATAVAGLAAGLWLGRATLPVPLPGSARLHALPLLLPALASSGALDTAVAIGMLLLGLALGTASRHAAAGEPP